MKTLSGMVAVVTGAASGIGRAASIRLAEEGCRLAIADINEGGLKETAGAAAKIGAKVSTHLIDVSSRDQMALFPEEVLQHHEHIHLLFNNAGCAAQSTLLEGRLEDFEWLMEINFWGVVYGCKYFLPYLLNEPDAHIVNMSSVFGLMGLPGQSYYCAAKFAVKGFTDALREELRDTGVRVSCVLPGGIKTNIARTCRFNGSRDAAGHEDMIRLFEEKLAKTSAEEAAAVIVKGILKNSPRILIGRDARLIDILQRLLPTGGYRLLASLGSKEKQT